jgi:SAM-dependent methyltransferase
MRRRLIPAPVLSYSRVFPAIGVHSTAAQPLSNSFEGRRLYSKNSEMDKNESTNTMQKLKRDQERLAQVIKNKPNNGDQAWETLWKEGVTPWDAGEAAPPLLHLLKTTNLVPNDARVLVPGCGSGYDVIAFATNSNRRVIGLEISETAAQVARKKLEESGIDKARADIRVGNFFTIEMDPFDVIYDYTFLCALPEELRGQWASGMSRLLKPSGSIITLIFPIGQFQGGPPYAMSIPLVKELLGGVGFEEVWRDNGDLKSVPARQGRERLLVWRRSHPAAKY